MQIKHDGSVSDRTMPITNVSWIRVQAFIETLNANSNHKYRLPKAAEWEYACLGASFTPGSDSSTVQPLPKRAIASDPVNIAETGGLLPINRQLPNLAGLFDLPGNSWEWTSDSHSRSEKNGMLTRLVEWFTTERIHQIVMGGSYSSLPAEIGCTSEKQAPISIGSPDIGFRLIMVEQGR